MSYKMRTFVVAVISIGLGVGHVSPLSAAEQTARVHFSLCPGASADATAR